MERNQIAFISFGASCVIGAFLIARLELRVRQLETGFNLLGEGFNNIHEYLDADFQEEVDEKFEEIVEKLDED
jgi:hypothetical protein